MNNYKTEIILYGTKQQLAKINISSVNVGGNDVKCCHKLNCDRYKRNVMWIVLESIVNFNQYICHRTS